MSFRKNVSFLCAPIVLIGCTTQLETVHIAKGFAPSTEGASYYLPKQSLKIEITYELRECPTPPARVPPGSSPPQLDAVVKKTAIVTATNVLDAEARFVLAHKSLSSGNKSTELTISTYENGTIKSVGAKIDDRTSEIIGSTFETAGKVARLALGGVAASLTCTDQARKTVSKRNELRRELMDPALYADEHERTAAVDAYNRMQEFLKIKRIFSFSPNPTAAPQANRVSKLDDNRTGLNKFNKWFANAANNADVKKLNETALCIRVGVDGGDTLGAQPKICSKALKVDVGERPKEAGLAYRDPYNALVVICDEKCDANGSNIIGAKSVQLAQFGDWRNLSLKSKPFQDRNVAANFSSAGRLISFTAGGSAALEALAGSLSKGVDAAASGVETSRSSDINKLNAELALTKAKADLIEQQQRLDLLEADTSATDELDP
ncbi:MAG: hypothetical protein AAFX54_13830 [Pseudomonadota bacterium]